MGNRRWLTLATTACVVAGSLVLLSPDARANTYVQGVVVNPDPVDFTPNVRDGHIESITTVGDKVFVGGTFSQVQEIGSSTVFTRNNIFAFDRNTGKLDRNFVPALNGLVSQIEPAPGGTSIFVGGGFSTVNGVANFGIAKLDVNTGAMVPGFTASTAGEVHDLAVSGNKVYLGGNIWSVNGVPRTRMAAIDATTGAVDPTFTVSTTQPRVSVDWVDKLDVSPDGTEMVIMGNFLAVDGQPRSQIARIDLTGPTATLMNWSTPRFGNFCNSVFWTYLRDVEYSLDGNYFVVVTTGGPSIGNLCDTASRWETSINAPNTLETWADWSGGDTLTAVAISDVAIYIGGHNRWMNNHLGRDNARPGAVVREGIAALDPTNGVPLSWNPGKHRGIAVWDLHLSDKGLYVGSDTDFTAGEYHAKLAQFPLTGGKTVPQAVPDTLPTTLYTGSAAPGLTQRSFDGTTFGTSSTVAGDPISWGSVGDAFVEAGKLYYINSNTLTSRTFDGTTFGPAVIEPSWTSWPSVTATTFDNGKLYYVETGSSSLKYRYFAIESGIVGSQTFTVSGGISLSGVSAMDIANNKLYYSKTDGDLWVVDLANGVPVNGTQQRISGPGTGDGRNWADNALFFLSSNTAPTISITAPADGAKVAGTVNVTAIANDAEGVAQVQFFVNGASIGTDTNGADGWSASWDSTTVGDGPASIGATVTDTSGSTATASIGVTVDNLGPTVSLTAPAAGTQVAGVVGVTADATDLVGVAQVEFFVNDVSIGVDTDGANGWGASWITTLGPDGAASIRATATDTSGRTASSSVVVTVNNGGATQNKNVLIVAGNPAALIPGEIAVRDRLVGQGYTVTVVDDNAATAADANGKGLVIINSTVSSTIVATTFRDVTVPVWVAKPYLLDDMAMTGTNPGVDYGMVTSATVAVTTPSHPIAAGLTGTATVYSAPQGMSFGVPGPAATVVTTANSKPIAFVYQPGAALANGNNAAGCRIGQSIFQDAPTTFAPQGLAMFDATVTFATNNCGAIPGGDGQNKNVVMVSGNPAALGAGEIAVRDRLVGQGYTVTVVDDNAATAADANGKGLVIINSSVSSAVLGTTFRDVTIPVWVAKPYLLDDMAMTGLTGGVDYGSISSATVDITAPTHPMAAGLTGTVTVYPTPQTMSFGIPGTGATIVSTASGKPVAFVYRAGATLASGGLATGCRIARSLFQDAPTNLTPQGLALIDATVTYATNNCPAP